MESVSLHKYLSGLKEKFKKTLSDPTWIIAEISEISGHNGNAYIALIEQENGKQVAKCSAICWSSQYKSIAKKFHTATGTDLQQSMKVLIKVTPALSERFGLQLTINDINPQFSLGDMEAKLRAIREKLQNKGAYTKNKAHPIPSFFSKVAVITPQGAAGREDFQKEADILQKHGVTEFIYFFATFQGEKAPESLATAIIDANTEHKNTLTKPFDAIFIVRGGGASSDLYWLNDYKVANYICHSLIPVFTGIGHERDSCILDEVAKQNLGTPSKSIYSIVNTTQTWLTHLQTNYTNSITKAKKITEQFSAQTNKKVSFIGYIGATTLQKELSKFNLLFQNQTTQCKQAIHNMLPAAVKSTQKNQISALQITKQYNEKMKSQVRNSFIAGRRLLRLDMQKREASVANTSTLATNQIIRAQERMVQGAGKPEQISLKIIQRFIDNINNAHRYIATFSPAHTLRMGYALIEQNGKIINSNSKLNDGCAKITFHDSTTNINLQKDKI